MLSRPLFVSYRFMPFAPPSCQVPFRLTRDIVDGFGVCGVDGVFRRSCETSLAVMRQNREALLTIVEVGLGGGVESGMALF